MKEVSVHKARIRRLGFGKHKGQQLKDIPTDYLKYLLRQDGFLTVRSKKATTPKPAYRRFNLSHGPERDIRAVLKARPATAPEGDQPPETQRPITQGG